MKKSLLIFASLFIFGVVIVTAFFILPKAPIAIAPTKVDEVVAEPNETEDLVVAEDAAVVETPETNKEVAATPRVKPASGNCGADIPCFVAAVKTNTLATFNGSITTDPYVGAITIVSKETWVYKPVNVKGDYTFSITWQDIDATFKDGWITIMQNSGAIPPTPEGTTITAEETAAAQQYINSMLVGSVGFTKTCTASDLDSLVTMLTAWGAGKHSATDLDFAKCTTSSK